ncbi:MAG: oligopeptide/dipeptide ABC transporter ATP-binding protein [Burkholderiales bacterium]|nr:hypothetical protein [Nitrosomonadaceae bacterium]
MGLSCVHANRGRGPRGSEKTVAGIIAVFGLLRSDVADATSYFLCVIPRRRDFVPIRGEIPSPLNPPNGCHFYPRCPHATAAAGCKEQPPILKALSSSSDRLVACHLVHPPHPAHSPLQSSS